MEDKEDNEEKKGDLLNQLAIIADLTEKINLEVKNPTLLFELDVEEYDRVKDYLKTKYNDKIDDEVINTLYKMNINFIALRCSGYNNVDIKAALKKIHVCRVPAYSPYAVAEHALAFDPGGGGQHQVSRVGGRCRVDLADDQETAVVWLALDPVQIGHRHPRVRGLHPHRLDVAAREGAEHVDGVVAGLLRNRTGLEAPDLAGIGEVEIAADGRAEPAFEHAGEGLRRRVGGGASWDSLGG